MIIGIDVGGTHIDGVLLRDKKIIKKEKILTGEKLFAGIWELLKILIEDIDRSKISRINLSTTVSTNAIAEDKMSKVAMFIQPGAGRNYDFLTPGDENINLSGYMDHRGTLVKGFDSNEVVKEGKRLQRQKYTNCGIVGKFSVRNPEEEIKAKNLLKEYIPHISLGHRMSGNLNFERRVNTIYLNEGVFNTWNDFVFVLKKSLEEEEIFAPIYVLKADGGTMELEDAKEKPVETILSGPAASYMGITSMFHLNKDALLLDVGGTTTDIFFLADGVTVFEPLGIEIKEYKTLVRAIYSVSIGLGGDSKLAIQDNEIKIGPQRQGPAMGMGGKAPTPTDAMISLGLLNIGEKQLSQKGIEDFGKQLGMSMKQTAQSILQKMATIIEEKVVETLEKINSKPVYTIEELLYGKKIGPKEIKIIGGPAKVLAPILEEKMGIPCQYPKDYELANAIGAALARTTREIDLFIDTEKKILNVPQLGIFEKTNKNYNLKTAEKKAIEILKSVDEEDSKIEIIESNSFNMIDGFYTKGKNIRVKAQIKPGLIYRLEEMIHD